MLDYDLVNYKKIFPKWVGQMTNVYYICLLSPNNDQIKIIKEFFPKSKIHISTKRDWKLANRNNNIYDLIFAGNVLMYSEKPIVWFENILESCRYFWNQDSIDSYRNGQNQISIIEEADSMRFSYLPKYKSKFLNSFDLSFFDKNIIDFYMYSFEKSKIKHLRKNKHFLCFMTGFKSSNNKPRMTIPQIFLQYIRMIMYSFEVK